MFCNCGCGLIVKKGNKFIRGHNRRGVASHTTNGRWSMKYSCCIECGTSKRKHSRFGYCTACARRLLRAGEISKKRNLTGGKWSKRFECCNKCYTKSKPHRAHGLCNKCIQSERSRNKGVKKRNYGGWSWYYSKCVKCCSQDKKHIAKGLCVDCYDEVRREGLFNILKSCPVCGVKVYKLNQHLTMKAKRCKEHLEFYNTILNIIIAGFLTDKSAGNIASEVGVSKKKVLNVWRSNFSAEEIRSRGEKIRIKSISGDKHYLYGATCPTIANKVIDYVSKSGVTYKMRSTWEVKYAGWLDENNILWEYEKYKFKYFDLYGGSHYYFPDFYLPSQDLFIEIKGYMDSASAYKIIKCVESYKINIEVLQKEDLLKLGIEI